MKKLCWNTLLISLLFVYNSCDDDPQLGTVSDITMNFNALYGTSPLDSETLTWHAYEGSSEIRFNKFLFYISDVVLYRDGETDETELTEIDLVDLTMQNRDTKIFRSVPTGDYSGLKFYVGVTEDLNKTVPGDYGSEHPLGGENAHHWSAWSSYVFSKIEGKFNPNDGVNEEKGFSIHPGSDQLLRSVVIPFNILLDPDGNKEINVNIDVKKLFYANDSWWNLLDFSQTHNPQDEDHVMTATNFMNNFPDAIRIE